MHTQVYKERLLTVAICSVLIKICAWLPLSLFLSVLLPSAHSTSVHPPPGEKQDPAQQVPVLQLCTEVVAQLCFVLLYFAMEKMGVFPQGETLFSSFCCL